MGEPIKSIWLPGWYATRLHAVRIDIPLFRDAFGGIQAECGCHVYEKARTTWAQRKVEKGIPHCKKCEKIISGLRGFKAAIKYVAIRPNGTVCGPIGDTWDFVQKALRYGHERTGGSGKWEDIVRQGYRIERARIVPAKEEDG